MKTTTTNAGTATITLEKFAELTGIKLGMLPGFATNRVNCITRKHAVMFVELDPFSRQRVNAYFDWLETQPAPPADSEKLYASFITVGALAGLLGCAVDEAIRYVRRALATARFAGSASTSNWTSETPLCWELAVRAAELTENVCLVAKVASHCSELPDINQVHGVCLKPSAGGKIDIEAVANLVRQGVADVQTATTEKEGVAILTALDESLRKILGTVKAVQSTTDATLAARVEAAAWVVTHAAPYLGTANVLLAVLRYYGAEALLDRIELPRATRRAPDAITKVLEQFRRSATVRVSTDRTCALLTHPAFPRGFQRAVLPEDAVALFGFTPSQFLQI